MPLLFADPTYDISFKRLFGEKENVKLTKSFLNEILGRKEEHRIEEITFVGTEKNPRFKKEKKTYIDIQCKDGLGNEFIIEMQSAKEDFFKKRVQYYVAHAIARQLERGAFYTELKPVIFIGVLDFHLFKSSKKNNKEELPVITHHLITDNETHEQTLDLMEFHFVELPKFKKKADELKTETDKWLFFLTEASKLEKIPKSCAKSEIINEAFHIMERATWDKKDWEAYEEERKMQIYIATQDHVSGLKKQKMEEKERKLEETRVQLAEEQNKLVQEQSKLTQEQSKIAEEQSKLIQEQSKLTQEKRKLEEDKQKIVKKIEATAIKLLKMKTDISEIVDLTGLSVHEIESLRIQLKK